MQEILDEPVFVEENELPPPIETEEDMPLDEFDKAWIAEAFNSSRNNAAPGPNLGPAPAPPTAPPTLWQRHGNTAQMGAFIVAIVLGAWNIWNHYTEANAKTTDEHTKALIGDQLTIALKPLSEAINSKTDALGLKIEGLSGRVSRIEGSLGNRISTLESRADQQTSLARLLDPNRILATIRTEIELAETKGVSLPQPTMVDYRNAVQALPSSANSYWETIAAIINYQSKLNQMSGEAPDPATVSRPCFGLTNSGNFQSSGNSMMGQGVRNCIADLDTNKFEDVTFVNSVIRYNGGPTSLINVKFINCRFILNLPAKTRLASSPFLLALLEAGDHKAVGIASSATP